MIVFFAYFIEKHDNYVLKSPEKNNVRLLVLIIASDDQPVYPELQKIWRSYMHSDPEHVVAYFMKGDPYQEDLVKVQDDVIWIKTPESIIPGILNKTILTMSYMLPVLDEFDYVLRANLSSFYVFPRLLNFLKTCPKNNFYCGSNLMGRYASGSGFILSPDIVRLLVKNKDKLLNKKNGYDDVLLGRFITSQGIKVHVHDRMDFLSKISWRENSVFSARNIFQFRVKTPKKLRLTDDIFIQKKLRNIFY